MDRKIIKAEKLLDNVPRQRSDINLVFTNGCFDLLHPGHVEYLTEAKALGDLLVVGINDDASVSRQKGPSRPINGLVHRMTMLSALQSVDYVVAFTEDTPLEIIKILIPDVLVKGGDYKKEDVVGADFVEANGGDVVLIPFKEGHSSTGLIEKIRNADL